MQAWKLIIIIDWMLAVMIIDGMLSNIPSMIITANIQALPANNIQMRTYLELAQAAESGWLSPPDSVIQTQHSYIVCTLTIIEYIVTYSYNNRLHTRCSTELCWAWLSRPWQTVGTPRSRHSSTWTTSVWPSVLHLTDKLQQCSTMTENLLVLNHLGHE